MDLFVETMAQNKTLLAKVVLLEQQVSRYKELFREQCAKSNRLSEKLDIATTALFHIAEHSHMPDDFKQDVASDALYRIGQMEAEKNGV